MLMDCGKTSDSISAPLGMETQTDGFGGIGWCTSHEFLPWLLCYPIFLRPSNQWPIGHHPASAVSTDRTDPKLYKAIDWHKLAGILPTHQAIKSNKDAQLYLHVEMIKDKVLKNDFYLGGAGL